MREPLVSRPGAAANYALDLRGVLGVESDHRAERGVGLRRRRAALVRATPEGLEPGRLTGAIKLRQHVLVAHRHRGLHAPGGLGRSPVPLPEHAGMEDLNGPPALV